MEWRKKGGYMISVYGETIRNNFQNNFKLAVHEGCLESTEIGLVCEKQFSFFFVFYLKIFSKIIIQFYFNGNTSSSNNHWLNSDS